MPYGSLVWEIKCAYIEKTVNAKKKQQDREVDK